MDSSEPVDPVTPLELSGRILHAARQFLQAAKLCAHNGGEAAPQEWLMYPSIVNFAFAAELALKGLHVVHFGKPVRGHDLSELCLALPADVMARVRGSSNPARFEARLAEVRDAFEVWRYAYEKDSMSISTSDLHELAKSAVDVLAADQKGDIGP